MTWGKGKKLYIYLLACIFMLVALSLSYGQSFSQQPDKVTIEPQRNDGFIRILFRAFNLDKLSVNLSGDTVTVDFGGPINTDFDRLISTISDELTGAEMGKNGSSIVLKFRRDDFELRKFTSKKFAGVDIIIPKTPYIKEVKKQEEKATTKPAEKLKNFSSFTPVPRKKPEIIKADENIYGPPLPPPSQNQDSSSYPSPVLKSRFSKASIEDAYGPKPPEEFEKKLLDVFRDSEIQDTEPPVTEEWDGEKAITWDYTESIPLEIIQETKEEFGPPFPPEGTLQEMATVELPPEPEQEVKADSSSDENGNKYSLTATIEKIENGTKIIFPWRKGVAAAVYKRAGYLWAIFSKHEVVDIRNLKASGFIQDANQIFHQDYTILRMDIGHKDIKPLNTSVYKDGLRWIIQISQGEQAPAELAIDVNLDIGSILSKAIIPLVTAAEPLKMLDPVVGDKLVVIPLYREKLGVTPVRNFIDFDLPESIQGIVVALKSDKTFVTLRKQGAIIAKNEGLNLYSGIREEIETHEVTQIEKKLKQIHSLFPFDSSNPNLTRPLLQTISDINVNEESPEEQVAGIENAKEGIEDPEDKESAEEEADELASKELLNEQKESAAESSEDKDEEGVFEKRQKLMAEITETASLKEKNEKRFELARLYFSNGLFAESLGVLEIAVSEQPGNDDILLNSILGASHYMMGHYVEATQIFEKLADRVSPSEGKEEITLWWWASNNQIRPRSQQTTKTIALNYLENIDLFLSEYPTRIRQEFGLLAAESLIEKNKFLEARSILDLLRGGEDSTKVTQNSIKFLEGTILAKEDFVDDAITIWTALSKEADDRYNRARATFAMYKLKYTLDRASKKETIENLDKLRIVWKGDDFELELLKFLGGLYVFERDFVNGLRTWRELVTQFPKTQEALLIARQMKKTFIDLFDKGVAYDLDPFVALTLYFEFRELTPVGEVGDNIIRQLVDHFVAADLLENAAALLTHQVRFRSKGDERVKLAVKLAEIHLTNKRPDLTIQALDYVQDSQIPDDVRDQYKYLRTRALVQMGKYRETLKLLSDDWSKTAQNLRLDIFLDRQNWFGIMNITEPRLAEVIERGDPIKGESLKDLLLLSISYATQQEYEKLAALQKEFIDKIEDQSGRTIFAFVTNDRGMVNYLKFDTTVQLEDIASFVTNYMFWPSREWASVIDTLEPQINSEEFAKKETLSQEDNNQVVQLAIAYAMKIKADDDNEMTKRAKQGLKKLQREFSKVQVDEKSLPIFLSLTNDPDLIPEEALKNPTPLKNIETFVDSFQGMLKEPESVL